MLPVTVRVQDGWERSLAEYSRRMLSFRQMDCDYCVWQMLQLCVDPKRVYRTTSYHSNTKQQSARDDPAFLLVLFYTLILAVIGWFLALGCGGLLSLLQLVSYVILIDFLALGALLASFGWWLSNSFLHERGGGISHLHHERRVEWVEWRYAFDVHCNAFVPVFVLLYLLQYLLLPLLLSEGIFVSLLSNVLYAVAFSCYHYLTFLGYSELPYLRNCEYFVYPVGLVLAAFVSSLPATLRSGFSCTWFVAGMYFGVD